ncbi:MAG: hypothetical protein M0Q49_07950 [Porticoccaceae bacterium]|nr:hypothetical protein [Porticoccaceae bacterium]MCK9469334.1 hypothetical protein [Porticoccaceae bacterium]
MADHRFWNQLLEHSEQIATLNARTADGRAQLLSHLYTLEEGTEPDPADDFEAFVALSLCRSVARALSQS